MRLQDIDGRDPDATVADAMTRDAHEIAPGASAADAFAKIQQAPCRRLLVRGEGGTLIGVLSTTDPLRAVQVRLMGLDPWSDAHETKP